MGLNVKLALLISLSFIGAMSWLVHEVAWPLTGAVAQAASPPEGSAGPAVPVASAGSAETSRLQGRFARTSASESQPANRRSPADTVVLRVPPIERAAEPEAVVLPPMIRTNSDAADMVMEPALASRGNNNNNKNNMNPTGGTTLIALNPGTPVPIGAEPGRDADVLKPTAGNQAAPDGASAANSAKHYRIQTGDTLAKIAQREWKRDDPQLVALLIKVNPKAFKNPDRILVGQEIVIPDLNAKPPGVAPAAPPVAAAKGSKAKDAPKTAALTNEIPAPAGQKTGDKDKRGRDNSIAERKPAAETAKDRWYIIQERDSLTNIARRELNDERRWREIAKLNGLRDGSRIVPGTRIKLPSAEKVAQR